MVHSTWHLGHRREEDAEMEERHDGRLSQCFVSLPHGRVLYPGPDDIRLRHMKLSQMRCEF